MISNNKLSSLDIAILLPCFNEEGAIGDTISSFYSVLPECTIYVYDNNSTDNTVSEAISAGAIVKKEPKQGKGEVVRRMFSDIEADIYIMSDGDNTYDPSFIPQLLNIFITEDIDMVIGARSTESHSYPKGHILGNKAFSLLINYFFKANLKDVFSGYRIMRRRFVKTLPVFSDGFQIETELTVHALHHKFPIKELPTNYNSRPLGTKSKLKTFSDGWKILKFIFFLIRDIKPLLFFGSISILLSFISIFIGVPVINEFLHTGLVPRFPTAILSSSIAVISIVSLFSGVILENVSRGRRENITLSYLRYKK
ncbi:glycosyltransferase [Vibrio sp. DW001]|uniref:glycosyltransferase family 2 protein n=1 Tax=Vibrio sp. DW001 TaxID=2912315 RepID=UPI0023B1E616|nr:glycosyltransferase [Vibrio sp. DW001]WED27058.1 glycosyltransferase [Vibrio sp. DW001]